MHDRRPDTLASTGSPTIGGDAIGARVLLVGRTGLDSRLRLDPKIELIRVKRGCDAIGELANPAGEVPGRTVVIVGDCRDIDERTGGSGAFVAGVRRIDADAQVVLCAGIGSNNTEPGAYDSVVGISASIDELRELVHGKAPTPPEPPASRFPVNVVVNEDDLAALREVESLDEAEQPEAEPEIVVRAALAAAHETRTHETRAHEAPAATDHGAPAEHRNGTPGVPVPPDAELDPMGFADTEVKPMEMGRFADADGVLVAAMLGGRDVLESAMGLIRARASRSDIEFTTGDDEDQGDDACAPVEWSGRVFGALRWAGGAEHASEMEGHARWLGMWLALADQQRRLRLESYTDPVSGAWNRRYFDRFLDAALPHARQRRHKLTVLVFDVDNFKSFNDRFGHEAGDMILTETVKLLKSMTRPSDRICRIGGDEFAVIFYEPEGPRDKHSDHPDDFELVAGRFQRAVEDQRFPKLGIEAPGELTISGGLATFPWDGQTADELLRRADHLAIASKNAGKNQITFGHTDEPEQGEHGA